MLVMNWQLFDALGIFLGFSADLIFYWAGKSAWRIQIGSACLPAVALMALVWMIPESPRWLLKKGRVNEAFASLCSLRPTHLQAAIELFYAHAQIQLEMEYMGLPAADEEEPEDASEPAAKAHGIGSQHLERHDVVDLTDLDKYPSAVAGTHYIRRIKQLFVNARIRRSTFAAGIVMLGQQLCGMCVEPDSQYGFRRLS